MAAQLVAEGYSIAHDRRKHDCALRSQSAPGLAHTGLGARGDAIVALRSACSAAARLAPSGCNRLDHRFRRQCQHGDLLEDQKPDPSLNPHVNAGKLFERISTVLLFLSHVPAARVETHTHVLPSLKCGHDFLWHRYVLSGPWISSGTSSANLNGECAKPPQLYSVTTSHC